LSAGPTPSQTVGPFFSLGLCQQAQNELAGEADEGAVWIRGHVLDGADAGVPDAMVEAWVGDRWGRSGTDADGRYSLHLAVPGTGDGQAPHVPLLVFARGLLKPVLTRLYFPDQAEANATDPVLAALDDQARAGLVAAAEGDGLRFDVRLQGPEQTTFFAQ
jgi:protocatechuate 3,4-dioxygenase, alpha subunit